MKALSKLSAEQGIWLSDAEIPSTGPNDLLIKINKTAICGTDMHIYAWDKWAQSTIPVPMIVGHEYVGTVVAIGQEVRGFELGDRGVRRRPHYLRALPKLQSRAAASLSKYTRRWR